MHDTSLVLSPPISMASELLRGHSIEVSESYAYDMMKHLNQNNQAAMLYKFDELLPSELSLVQHIEEYVKSKSKMGPWIASTLLTCTDALLIQYKLPDVEAARDLV